ncbi:MAG: hypothetical protein M3142_06000, partial [Bacteroidota bacterium]|nr:hypothetical protein [Bacteroidota bacterium]
MKFPFHFCGTRVLPAWVLVVFCLLVSCRGNRNELRLETKNFEEQIEQEQNLVFTFDKELAPPAILQKWDTINYLNFTPKVKGRFKWTAPNELVFSPLQPFAPSTDFQAELTDQLLKHSPQKYSIPSGQTIRFHTPYLDLTEAQAFWGPSQNSPDQLEARVRVAFNYPVTYASLRNYLQVLQGPATVPVDLVNSSPEYISLRVKLLKNNTQPFRIQVKPGLVTPGSQYRTNQLIEKEVVLPNRKILQVSEVTTSVENGEEQIYVATTQPVQTENLRELVKLRPEYAFTVEEMEGGFVLRGNLPQQNTYDLVISKNLTGLEGAKLGQDYIHPVSFASVRPGIAFANTRSVYLSSQGARNIALNINKVPRFKVSIGKIYENNILRALQEGELYEGEYDEAADEYYSSSAYPVNETNGNTIFEREYDTNNLRKQGDAYLLNLNLDDLDFDSEFKGLYVLTVTSTEQKWLRDSKLISVSDIGLIAKQGKNDVIVFANSIREAKVQSGV